MKRIIIKTIAILAKICLLYYLGFRLGLGSYDPDSTVLYQNWRVWFFLYFPMGIGIESMLVTVLEAMIKAKESEGSDE
jgi:hypothetical protein